MMILVTFINTYSKDIPNSLYALTYLVLCHTLAWIVSQNHDKGQQGNEKMIDTCTKKSWVDLR